MALSPEMQALNDRWEANHMKSDEKAQRDCAERMERDVEKTWRHDHYWQKSKRQLEEKERNEFREWFQGYAAEYDD